MRGRFLMAETDPQPTYNMVTKQQCFDCGFHYPPLTLLQMIYNQKGKKFLRYFQGSPMRLQRVGAFILVEYCLDCRTDYHVTLYKIPLYMIGFQRLKRIVNALELQKDRIAHTPESVEVIDLIVKTSANNY